MKKKIFIKDNGNIILVDLLKYVPMYKKNAEYMIMHLLVIL